MYEDYDREGVYAVAPSQDMRQHQGGSAKWWAAWRERCKQEPAHDAKWIIQQDRKTFKGLTQERWYNE